jgi:integrase/recombinase XerD
LKFFFGTTLGRSWDIIQIPRNKKIHKLPVVLSQEEIKKLLAVTINLKFKSMFMIAYSAGLRLNEITHLKVSDIDSGQMQILVREGKGKVDRYSLLSEVTLKMLREYWKQYHPTLWLFPGKIPGQPMSNRAFQDAFQKARKKSGINEKASIHSLRHSFATHLLENGIDIVRIQHLMGHARIGTTTLYLHLAKTRILEVKSPLDALLEEDNHEA